MNAEETFPCDNLFTAQVSKAVQLFLFSAAGLLAVTGSAKLWSVTGDAKLLSTADPIIHLSYRKVMLIVGLVELTVALYLVTGRAKFLRATFVFWLASNFMIYRLASFYMQVSMCPCLGTLTSNLPISKAQADNFLPWTVLHLWFGSGWILVRAWSNSGEIAKETSDERTISTGEAASAR